MRKSRRQYSDIKQEYISKSLREDNQEEVDLALNNPLSQEEDVSQLKYVHCNMEHDLALTCWFVCIRSCAVKHECWYILH